MKTSSIIYIVTHEKHLGNLIGKNTFEKQIHKNVNDLYSNSICLWHNSFLLALTPNTDLLNLFVCLFIALNSGTLVVLCVKSFL